MQHSRHTATTSETPESTPDRVLQVATALVHELRPGSRPELQLDHDLDRDLGLDSLALVELLARLDQAFGVNLPDETLSEAQSLRDLVELLPDRPATSAPRTGRLRPAVSAGPGSDPPERAGTWSEVVDWHLGSQPERTHLRALQPDDEFEEVSFNSLNSAARRVAGSLADRGIGPGDRVALMLPTGRGYFQSFLGILLAGAVPVPIYPPHRRAQLEDHLLRQAAILDNAQVRLLITVPEARLVARQLRLAVPDLNHVATAEEMESGPPGSRAPAARPDDLALLQYTSGSTGAPKGVMLTHANLLANIRAMGRAAEVGSGREDVFVSWLPLYHDMGLIGAWLGSLYYGIPLVVMPPTSFLRRPVRWLQAIHEQGGTISASPNFGYELCLNRITDEEMSGIDLSSWRVAFNGAEPVSPQTLRRFTERFEPYGFRPEAMAPVYGLAESSLGLTFPPLGRKPVIDAVSREPFLRFGEARPAPGDEEHPLHFVSCGSPLSGHEVRITDPQGRALPDRRQGQIHFTGPSVTSGYHRNPEATGKLLRDGWLDSGDLGYFADGDLFVTGRAKDMIIRAGRNIHPQELEQAVGEVAGVRKGRVAVFGARGGDGGPERLVVVAETRQQDPGEKQLMAQEITGASVELLGSAPDDVVLAAPGTVLKTSSGKIRRADCRRLYEEGILESSDKPMWRQVAGLIRSTVQGGIQRAPGRLRELVYAVRAWAVFAVSAPLIWLLMALLPGLGLRWSVLRRAARLVLRLAGLRPQVQGRELFPREPNIVVSNHSSMLDGFVLAAVLPQRLVFVAAEVFARRRLTRIFLKRLGALFAERRDRAMAVWAAQPLLAAARRGATVVFFPEGRMSRRPGLQPFRMGAFAVAAETGLPVVPITIRGTETVLRGTARFPRKAPIEVIISEPVRGSGPGWEDAVRLRGTARRAILEHFHEPDLEG